jgi:hypothetical protein
VTAAGGRAEAKAGESMTKMIAIGKYRRIDRLLVPTGVKTVLIVKTASE